MKKQLLLTIIISLVCALGAHAAEPRATESNASLIPQLDCVIEPSEIVDIGSAVPGVVEKIHADRSDLVEAGTVLVELESSVEKAAHDLAKARSVLSTAIKLRQEGAAFGDLTQKRNQELMKTSAISRHNMDQLKTEAKIAKLQVKQEKDNKRIAGLEAVRTRALLDRRVIRTPVNGVVMERYKSVGEYIDEEPALRIAKLDPLHVEVIVPVSFLGQIKPGMQATVTPSAGNSEKRVATVERVDLVADAASATFGVRLTLPNPDYQVTAGLRCQVDFIPGENVMPATKDARIARTEPVKKTPVSKPKQAPVPAIEKQVVAVKPDPGAFLKVAQVKPVAEACYRIGPVVDKNIANSLGKKLEENTQHTKLHHEEVMATKDYVVMTPTVSSQQEIDDLQQQLAAAGISDHFVFTKGRHKNRISLGTYFYQQSAAKRVQFMASHGIDAKIVKRRKKATHYWLDVKLNSSPKGPGNLETVRKSYAPSAPLKQVSCS